MKIWGRVGAIWDRKDIILKQKELRQRGKPKKLIGRVVVGGASQVQPAGEE